MFYPGETITHSFTVPFVPEDIVKVIVTYKQKGRVVVVKEKTGGFDPVVEDTPSEDTTPNRDVVVIISGAEVVGTKLLINPSPEPPTPPPYVVIGSSFDIVFTQEESLLFEEGCYEAQINVLTVGNDRYTSAPVHGKVGEQHVRMVMAVEQS